jgi:cysteine desulfurase
LNDDLRLFALMAANNETGQIFDIKKVAEIVRKISARTRIHCDAVQAVGKIPLNFSEIGVDTLALSGHKLGAISGVGALIVSQHCQLEPWIFGGPQEFGLRAGTENVLAIKTLAIACRTAKVRLDCYDSKMLKVKETVLSCLHDFGDLAQVNSFGSAQLNNTISVRFPGIKADDLVVALDIAGVAISAGSACSSGRPSPSHVLLAHGMSAAEVRETVRISFEPDISEKDLEFGLSTLRSTLSRMINHRRAA